jgi:hypothetical protein
MRLRAFSLLFLALCVTWASSLAQSQCPILVEKALQAVDTNCSNMTRNSVCYGYTQVQAAFTNEVAEDFFTQPADRAELATLQSLKTTSLQLEDDKWGVAIMSLQANLPNALPGQAVTFVLLGDSEVENAVMPETAFIPTDPIIVRTASGANIRSGAGLNFNVIGGVNANAELLADARSEDTQWLRIVYQEKRVAWVSRTVLQADANIDTLPILDDTTRMSMQAFYLRTGVGRTECSEAPQDALMVQGPKNFQVNLTVNGADVKISSTVLFQIVGDNQSDMKITVLDGQAEVTPNTLDAETIIIPQGFSSTLCLSDPDNRGVDGETNDRIVTCNASEPTRIDNTLRDNTLCSLQDIPTSVLNYAVDLTCPGDPLPTPVPVRPTAVPQPQSTVSSNTNCVGFTILNPIFDVAYKGQFFEWASLPAAEEYVINLFNEQGNFLTGAYTGKATSIILDIGELRPGVTISWEASALVGGKILCTTPRSNNLYVQPEVTEPFSASYSCTNINDLVVSWRGATASDSILFYFDDDSEYINIGRGTSGTYRATFEYCDEKQGAVGTSSGQFYNLPPIYCGACPIG